MKEEEPEPVVEDKPKHIDKLKEMVVCPGCNLSMAAHTLKYIHKRKGYCKAFPSKENKPK